jgi:aspartate/methionine/tyrosine aminotransferase
VLAQRAALAAFTPESYAELDGHVRRYAGYGELLVAGLRRLGVERVAPADGAFYAYADVGHLTDDSMAFAREVLARTGVAVATGIDFDTVDGGRYLRFSFAGTAADIDEALDRLEPVLS